MKRAVEKKEFVLEIYAILTVRLAILFVKLVNICFSYDLKIQYRILDLENPYAYSRRDFG